MSLSVEDRNRVVNNYVIPTMCKDNIGINCKKFSIHEYHYSTDSCNSIDDCDFTEAKKIIDEYDESCCFESLLFMLDYEKNKQSTKYVVVIIFDPKENFNLSIYDFPIDYIFGESSYLKNTITETTYNPCYSNKILKSYLSWEHLADIGDKLNLADHVYVYTLNEITKITNSGFVKFNEYMTLCDRTLVPLDMQGLIKAEYKTGNLFILNIINYLKDYFLLVRIKDKKITFISSPNDKSL